MRILLIRLPNQKQAVSCQKDSLPLGLCYVKSYLEFNGYSDVDLVDANIEGWGYKETVSRILEKKYDVIGFTIIFRDMMEQLVDIVSMLRYKGVKSHFTIGGHYPSFEHENILTNILEIDSVALFESEITFLELVNNLKRNTSLSSCLGLAYRYGKRVIINDIRPLISKLDSIPFPDRGYLPKILKDDSVIAILTSRGCYGNCSFCSINPFYSLPMGKKWRGRTAKNIVDEIEYLISLTDRNRFDILDDNFFGPGVDLHFILSN